MASTKPSSSDNAKELKKLQKNIKLMNHQLRLKVDKAYVSKSSKPSFMHTFGLALSIMVHTNKTPQITAVTLAMVSKRRSIG